MNMNPKKMGGALLTLTLLFGIGIASSITTQAQWPNSSRNRDYEREQIRRQRQYEREQLRRQREAYRNNGYGYGRNSGRYGDGLPNYGGSFELRQTALNAGYNGVSRGYNY